MSSSLHPEFAPFFSYCNLYNLHSHIWNLLMFRFSKFCVPVRKNIIPDALCITCPTLSLQYNLLYIIKKMSFYAKTIKHYRWGDLKIQ